MGIHFGAVLLCAVAAMVLGTVWHSKLLFGPAFMDAAGMDTNMPPEKMKEIQSRMWQYYLTQFLLALLQASVLSLFVGGWTGMYGALRSFLIWLGFVMPTVAGASLWSPRPRAKAWKLFFISAGYQLVLFIVFGFILGNWN